MKLTKKIFLAAIAAATIALTGCDMLATLMGKQGEGTTTGTKWNKTMTVDGTKKDLYDKNTNEPLHAYRRFIKKIKTSEKVTNISTDIIIDTANSVLNTPDAVKGAGNAVVGMAFDFHTTGKGADAKYDFVLIGFAPNTGKYYIERYFDVLSAKAESAAAAMSDADDEVLEDAGFDSSDSAMGTYYNFKKDASGILKITDDTNDGFDDWNDLPEGAYDATTGTLNVEIKQETAGLYEICIGGTKVAEYEGTIKSNDRNYADFAAGGVAVYANTPVGKTYNADEKKGNGTKVKVKYSSDKSKTHGLFEDEE